MKTLNYKLLETSDSDNPLYNRIIKLLQEIRLVQGGNGLDATLRRHRKILNYCMAKQFDFLRDIEDSYFYDDGSVKFKPLNS